MDFSAIGAAQASPGPATTRSGDGGPARPLRAPTLAAPTWLGDENPAWRGNFRVRYWDQGWQSLMFGHETAALERIIGAGFDGVYLDRADVYQGWAKERPEARADLTRRGLADRAARSRLDAAHGQGSGARGAVSRSAETRRSTVAGGEGY